MGSPPEKIEQYWDTETKEKESADKCGGKRTETGNPRKQCSKNKHKKIPSKYQIPHKVIIRKKTTDPNSTPVDNESTLAYYFNTS
jgi:hypothetical protein